MVFFFTGKSKCIEKSFLVPACSLIEVKSCCIHLRHFCLCKIKLSFTVLQPLSGRLSLLLKKQLKSFDFHLISILFSCVAVKFCLDFIFWHKTICQVLHLMRKYALCSSPYPTIYLTVYLYACLFVPPSFRSSVGLFVCLFVYLCLREYLFCSPRHLSGCNTIF